MTEEDDFMLSNSTWCKLEFLPKDIVCFTCLLDVAKVKGMNLVGQFVPLPINDHVPESMKPEPMQSGGVKIQDHLGDGVYVAFTGYGLELRVNDHRNPEVIYLEPDVFMALIRFARRSDVGIIKSEHELLKRFGGE